MKPARVAYLPFVALLAAFFLATFFLAGFLP
jgi:hypothetical protein